MSDPGTHVTAAEAGPGWEILSGPEATEALGRDLAGRLRPGDVVLLSGEVGAGKSTLARAALRRLGVDGPIPSPTFTVGLRYEVETAAGESLVASHLDLYRLGDMAAEDPGLLDEYLGPGRIVFAEWPGGSADWLAGTAGRVFTVEIGHRDPESRLARITGPDD